VAVSELTKPYSLNTAGFATSACLGWVVVVTSPVCVQPANVLGRMFSPDAANAAVLMNAIANIDLKSCFMG
jgi:hypothetical protein